MPRSLQMLLVSFLAMQRAVPIQNYRVFGSALIGSLSGTAAAVLSGCWRTGLWKMLSFHQDATLSDPHILGHYKYFRWHLVNFVRNNHVNDQKKYFKDYWACVFHTRKAPRGVLGIG